MTTQPHISKQELTIVGQKFPKAYKSYYVHCTLFSSAVMTDEQKARLSTKRPLTKEEYEARQSVIRRVVDPETGRTR